MTLAKYQSSTHQGAGDTSFDPQLDASEAPAAIVGVVDAGVLIKASPTKSTCNGSPFSYCDRAPDIGATEREARKRKAGKRVKR